MAMPIIIYLLAGIVLFWLQLNGDWLPQKAFVVAAAVVAAAVVADQRRAHNN